MSQERKPLIIALVVVAAVVSMFIPMQIGGRLVEKYDRSKNQIANITLVAKTKDAAVFEYPAPSRNYYFRASVSLPDVEIGSHGYVANSSGVQIDGSYEHDHDFIFAQRGSLFQRLIGYYNPPYHGHVEGLVDPPDTASSVSKPAAKSSGVDEYFSQVNPILSASKASVDTIDESIAKIKNGNNPSTTELHRAGKQLRAAADSLSRLMPPAGEAEIHAELIAQYDAYGSGALEMEAALKNQSAESWERVNELMAEGDLHVAAMQKLFKARGLEP
jgi:hypothetical protein